MLKIKDNVDLKELEKYGFEYNKKTNEYEYGYTFHGLIYINEKDRIINVLYSDNVWVNFEEIFYNLIKADLVEKAVSNENI